MTDDARPYSAEELDLICSDCVGADESDWPEWELKRFLATLAKAEAERDEAVKMIEAIDEVADRNDVEPGFWGKVAARFMRQRDEARATAIRINMDVGRANVALRNALTEALALLRECNDKIEVNSPLWRRIDAFLTNEEQTDEQE